VNSEYGGKPEFNLERKRETAQSNSRGESDQTLPRNWEDASNTTKKKRKTERSGLNTKKIRAEQTSKKP